MLYLFLHNVLFAPRNSPSVGIPMQRNYSGWMCSHWRAICRHNCRTSAHKSRHCITSAPHEDLERQPWLTIRNSYSRINLDSFYLFLMQKINKKKWKKERLQMILIRANRCRHLYTQMLSCDAHSCLMGYWVSDLFYLFYIDYFCLQYLSWLQKIKQQARL